MKHHFACELSKFDLKVTGSQCSQKPEISVVWHRHTALSDGSYLKYPSLAYYSLCTILKKTLRGSV